MVLVRSDVNELRQFFGNFVGQGLGVGLFFSMTCLSTRKKLVWGIFCKEFEAFADFSFFRVST